MEKEEKVFTGIWIPKEVWHNKDLGWTEKLILVQINSLDNDFGCTQSNEKFGKFFNLSEDRVSRVVRDLVKRGYVYSTITRHSNNKTSRVLKVNKIKYNGITEDDIQKNSLNGKNNLNGENADEVNGENADEVNGENNEYINKSLNNKTNKDYKDIKTCPISSNESESDDKKSEKLLAKKAKEEEIELKFEQWYRLYANKQGRQKAFIAFKKVLKTFSFDELMKNTALYAEPYIKGLEDKNYQKHPSTFLNSYHPDDDFAYKPKQQFNRGGYQQNEGFKRADDFDSFKARTGVDAPF